MPNRRKNKKGNQTQPTSAPPGITQKKSPPSNAQTSDPTPPQKITELKQGGAITASLPSGLQLAARPPPGKSFGRGRKLTVNHYLTSIGAQSVNQYRVDFEPEVEAKFVKNTLLKSAESIIGSQYIFDGGNLFYSTQASSDAVVEARFKEIDYSVKIQRVGTYDINELSPQVYNVLCKKILQNLGLVASGRQYFDPRQAVKIEQHKIELWPGFFTSIGSTMRGATLCADIAHKIIRTDSVLQVISGLNHHAADNALNNQIVLTRYNNKTYRVDGIEWEMSPLSSFTRSGKKCTYHQYYQSVYNLTVTKADQPLLRVIQRKKDVIYLIPEFCFMTGLTDQMKNDFKVMQSLDTYTKVNPAQRSSRLKEFAETIKSNKEIESKMSEWQVSIDDSAMKILGSTLPPENIFCGQPKPYYAGDKALWNNRTVLTPANISKCLFIHPKNIGKEANTMLSELKKFSQQFRMNISNPKVISIDRDDPKNYESAIKDNISESTDMVVCMLDKAKNSYDRIKVICCNQLGIPSQCVLAKSMRNPKRLNSIASKIVQQINCKAGGELWKVPIPLENTMIVGIDVCHDTYSDKGRGKRSVVGFCASTNSTYTQYFSTVKFQSVGQEIVDELAECFEEALDNWKTINNNNYPQNVIVYRDGVGEGQFLSVLEYEVPQIQRVIKSKNQNIKLTEVIVQKRIHTRLFDHSEDINNPRNVPAGTVVDNGCVSKDSYDFYMVSQNVTQGTATPSHYRVILDEIKLPSNTMQYLTFKLCHLYFNWAGTIRVPAPCQYAHKIAFLIGKSVHQFPHENLKNKLHFL